MRNERPVGAICWRIRRIIVEYLRRVLCFVLVWLLDWMRPRDAKGRIRNDCVELHVLEVVVGERIARKYRRIGYASRLFRFCAVNLDAILAHVVAEDAQKPAIAARRIVDFRDVRGQLCPHLHCECLGRVKRALITKSFPECLCALSQNSFSSFSNPVCSNIRRTSSS